MQYPVRMLDGWADETRRNAQQFEPHRDESRDVNFVLVPATPIATVVVVARDRWSQTPATLETLLARTDRRHRIVFVDGHAPRPVATALDRLSASGRIRVVRHNRFLASNEARNLGAEG